MSRGKKAKKTVAKSGAHTQLDRHLYDLLDNLLEGFQIIGRDWRYLYVNEAVARQGKRTKEELLGKTMMEMYPGIDKTEMFSHLKRCMKERTWHETENEFEFPDGSKGWFALRMEPVPEGIFILSLDITEQKRAEEIKREAEVAKTKEDFLFRTVHDLKAPTAIIRTILEDYRDNGLVEKYAELKESYELIDAANQRMQKLINYLFQYARGEQKEIVLKKKPLDATKLIREILREFKPIMAKRKVTASFEGKEPLMVLGDGDALKEVVSNLLDNAVKYNKEGGTIAVAAKVQGKTVIISITDSGIGISEEKLPKLFSPYYRAYSGADIQGTGLGLFIVKGLVEKMEGKIEVASKIGEGTTFTVILPAAARTRNWNSTPGY